MRQNYELYTFEPLPNFLKIIMEQLTIAIPTYNRQLVLEKLLSRLNSLILASKHKDNIKIAVVDNCSTFSLDGLKKKFTDVVFYRNNCNIGMVSNINRCLEYCETEWCWILGDDDNVCENSLDIIFINIRLHQKSSLINFRSNLSIKKNNESEVIIHESRRLLNEIDYSNLLLISNNVISTYFFKKYLSYILERNHNLFHYLNALPIILENEQTYIVKSNDRIVEWVPPSENVDSWDRDKFYSNAASFIDNYNSSLDRISSYREMIYRSPLIKPKALSYYWEKGNLMNTEIRDNHFMKILYSIKFASRKKNILKSVIKLLVLTMLSKNKT
jgi:glycosyltransferase involved in cell wall biosynthesis